MNQYQIELCGYNMQGQLKIKKLYTVSQTSPCKAQIKLLLENVMSGDSEIQQCEIVGGFEYEVRAINGWMYRTHNIKRIQLHAAY